MNNTLTATVAAHDAAAGVSWLNWRGLRFRVPLVSDCAIGSRVSWELPSDQVRLLSRGDRPLRKNDTAFPAEIVGISPRGDDTDFKVRALDKAGGTMSMTVPTAIAVRNGIRTGDSLTLRLRGDSITVHSRVPDDAWRLTLALLAGAAIGALGGLIGLGGAEFRLPLLIGLFGFAALHAVILNKAASLMVVTAALFFRMKVVPADMVLEHWTIVANLLAGSLLGAWLGAGWATRLKSRNLYRIIGAMLVLIAVVLVLGHDHATGGQALLSGGWQLAGGIAAGFVIGVVASVLGVAGGELLIPTLVLLFGADIKLAGSLSLAVSLPTMIVGFTRYSRDRSFSVLAANKVFLLVMAIGSVIGAAVGGVLLGIVPAIYLLPALAAILLISAIKVWRH